MSRVKLGDVAFERKETLKNKLDLIYSTNGYLEATKRGIRPVARIKKLTALSREEFNVKDN